MPHPSRRDDLSRFLVHLTRHYDNKTACENLIGILRDKKIDARNPHCLFKHEVTRLGFSQLLRKGFHTVCLTETPLTQIHRLTGTIKGRQIELQGYGLVFNKNDLIGRGASPAIYLNAKGTKLRDYLLNRFRDDFQGITKLKALAQQEQEHYGSIMQYYALINIIADHYDFTWEREWRYSGPLKFKYRDLVAIVAPDPESFASECRPQLPDPARKYLEMIPIIAPTWTYDDIVDTMSVKIWDANCKPTA